MRVWVLLISLVLMLVVVAACGDDEGDGSEVAEADTVSEASDDPTTTPEPEPTATPAPEPTPEPEPTQAPTEVAEEEAESTEVDEQQEQDSGEAEEQGAESGGALESLLLSAEDLPADWTETSTGSMDDAAMEDLADNPFEAPCGIEPLEEAFEPVNEGQRAFQGTEMGPFFTHAVAELGSSDDAASSLDHIRTLFECDEWIETDEMGEEIVFEINRSDIGDVGDDVVALRVSFNLGDSPEMEMLGDIGFDMVFFRRGEYVSSLMFFDMFGMSDVDFPGLVQLADEKLESGT